MDEDFIDVEYMIEYVRRNPCIWDRSLPEHHTRAVMAEAWRNVAGQMNVQFGDMSAKKKEAYCKLLQKKWRNIRDQWAKSLRKAADQRKAGTPTRQIKHYVYHEQLRFLQSNSSETDCDVQENSNSQHSDSKDLDAGSNNNINNKQRSRTGEDPKEKKQKLDNESKQLGTWNTSLIPEHDSKLYFFKSILPSIEDFSVDEMLEFQSGIIDLVKGIKVNRYYQPPLENNDCGGTKACSLLYTPTGQSNRWHTLEHQQKNFATPRDSPAPSDEQSTRSTSSSSSSDSDDSSTGQQSDSSKDDSDAGNKDKAIPSHRPSVKVSSRRPTTADDTKKRAGSRLSESFSNGKQSQIGLLQTNPDARHRRSQRGRDAENAVRKRKSLSRESK